MRAAHASRIVLPTVPLSPADVADESPRSFCLDEVCIQSSKFVQSRDAKGKKESLKSPWCMYKVIGMLRFDLAWGLSDRVM